MCVPHFISIRTELQLVAQFGLNVACSWLRTNKLTLNTGKTKLMTYSISAGSQPSSPISLEAHSCSSALNVSCQCPKIAPVDTIKYLGVILDKFLSFKNHILLLTSRMRKLIYFFKVLRHVTNPTTLRNVYFAMCRSVITYCISCWGGCPKTTLKPLEVAQRAILKVATFRHILFPTKELYNCCRVLTVRQLFILDVVLRQHRIVPYTILTKRRKDLICIVPSANYSFVKRFSFYLGPLLYNKINAELQLYGLR